MDFAKTFFYMKLNFFVAKLTKKNTIKKLFNKKNTLRKAIFYDKFVKSQVDFLTKVL